jgi:hypothetical protein
MAALTTRCTDPKDSSCVTRGVYTCRKTLGRCRVGLLVGPVCPIRPSILYFKHPKNGTCGVFQHNLPVADLPYSTC